MGFVDNIEKRRDESLNNESSLKTSMVNLVKEQKETNRLLSLIYNELVDQGPPKNQ